MRNCDEPESVRKWHKDDIKICEWTINVSLKKLRKHELKHAHTLWLQILREKNWIFPCNQAHVNGIRPIITRCWDYCSNDYSWKGLEWITTPKCNNLYSSWERKLSVKTETKTWAHRIFIIVQQPTLVCVQWNSAFSASASSSVLTYIKHLWIS